MQKRGLKVAIDYLKSMSVELVPDDIKKRAGLDIMVPTLAHSLRRAARQGKVQVIYKPDSTGTKIAYYKAASTPMLYFYTIQATAMPSPYFTSLEQMRANMPAAATEWSGSYDAPTPVGRAE